MSEIDDLRLKILGKPPNQIWHDTLTFDELSERVAIAIAEQESPRDLSVRTVLCPVFLLNAPFSLSADDPNNAWMRQLPEGERRIDKHRAFNEWFEFYSYLSSMSLVYLLPSVPGLQDQVYVANLGIVLPHIGTSTVVLSNFRSRPRQGEEPVGSQFFRSMGYNVIQAPEFFEGEADLKYLGGSTYAGAFGLRTSAGALDWFERTFDMNVITIDMIDPKLYHLDCLIFPIDREHVLACTEVIDAQAVQRIEQAASIIDVSLADAHAGITNCVKCRKLVMASSKIDTMKTSDDDYLAEVHKNAMLERICMQRDLELCLFPMAEAEKSGAMLSCHVMHLNWMADA
jgi:N-dimethylarginine dimethylaminohydrolase